MWNIFFLYSIYGDNILTKDFTVDENENVQGVWNGNLNHGNEEVTNMILTILKLEKI